MELNQKVAGEMIKNDNSPIRKFDDKTFIFIHINKTGGTSISNAIGLPQKKHLQVKEVIEIIGEAEFNNAFVFTVVRNPFDKVVSHYKFRVMTNQTQMGDNHISFKNWVKQAYFNNNPIYYDNPKMFCPQSNWLKDKNGEIRVVNILRFENLENDFKQVAAHLGINNKLPHLNATAKNSCVKYYDRETLNIVRDWFSEDIERFKYSSLM